MYHPHPIAWLRAHPRGADALLTALVVGVAVAAHLWDDASVAEYREPDPAWWTVLLVLCGTVPIYWRRTRSARGGHRRRVGRGHRTVDRARRCCVPGCCRCRLLDRRARPGRPAYAHDDGYHPHGRRVVRHRMARRAVAARRVRLHRRDPDHRVRARRQPAPTTPARGRSRRTGRTGRARTGAAGRTTGRGRANPYRPRSARRRRPLGQRDGDPSRGGTAQPCDGTRQRSGGARGHRGRRVARP